MTQRAQSTLRHHAPTGTDQWRKSEVIAVKLFDGALPLCASSSPPRTTMILTNHRDTETPIPTVLQRWQAVILRSAPSRLDSAVPQRETAVTQREKRNIA